jgi:UDP-glucose 4-epimerase
MAFNRLISSALAGRPFEMFGDGAQTRDFTFVADAVAGTIAAAHAGTPGSAYNIGGGSRRSMNSVLDTLGDVLGTPVERTYTVAQVGDARDTGADVSRARADLGYEPSFDFESGLRAQVQWQRAVLAGAGAKP